MATPDDNVGPNLESKVENHPFGSIKWHARSPLFAGEAPSRGSISSLSKEASMPMNTSNVTAFTSACSNFESISVDDSGMAPHPSGFFKPLTDELHVFDEVDLEDNQDICELTKENPDESRPLFPESCTVVTPLPAPSPERPSPSFLPASARMKALTALAEASTEAFTVHPMERVTPQRPFEAVLNTQEGTQPSPGAAPENIVAQGIPEETPRRVVRSGATKKIETMQMFQSFEAEENFEELEEQRDEPGEILFSETEDSVDSEEVMNRRLRSPVSKELARDEKQERQAVRICALEQIIANLQLELM
jgi:hypothetical protein